MSANPRNSNDSRNGDDKLRGLAHMSMPSPSAEARERALGAALSAFDAEAAKAAQGEARQGRAGGGRLRSILKGWTRTFAMDIRIPIGASAIALLMLPLGYQLYTSTALTGLKPVAMREAAPLPESEAMASRTEVAADAVAETAAPPAAASAPAMVRVAPSGEAARKAPVAEFGALAQKLDAPAMAEGLVSPSSEMRAPMPVAPMVPVAAPEASVDTFTRHAESPVRQVATDPVSTFSLDVDTASYAYVRRMLEQGILPAPDAVRVEEMVNYFPYDYMPPPSADVPFAPVTSVLPSPWNAGRQVVHIGIKGYAPPAGIDQASNLVFLIDTSGSMDEPDKLPLLKRAFALLVEQLSGNDTVSIVAYAGSAGVVLEPTSAREKAKILAALDTLGAGGSTAGAEGIELAYRLAEEAKVADGVNRVILATDGDFNVGISDPEALKDYIRTKRDGGIFLSVLGFGQGNLDDATMQALAQNGNGNASHIDSFREARKVLVEQGGATLTTIAKDVKVQVEFNPALVTEYRLVGYESRALNREDFNNDRVDAGDVGAGHTVTAIYEITPVGSPATAIDPLRYDAPKPERAAAPAPDAELGFVKLRYKLPNETASRLIEVPIRADSALELVDNGVDDVRFSLAVAGFAQKLKQSDQVAGLSWQAISELAQGARGADEGGYRAEFIQLVNAAAALSPGGEDVPCSVVNGERVCR